ncbi:SDR family oxidoreductase [Streptomyces sp. NRRL WC-3549]|uniref:SDR family oxidoreductase n=1 Tax=Streptomyces sp. NRRL WC-3549 TaxID=1463925 RepID=UPI0004C75368|nr:SDR family oxidoreductase [Streptomyces sp. NRRL WC-3549]
MRVALTGATGFLGLRLARELLEQHGSLTVLAHAGSGGALGRVTRFMELSGAPAESVAELPHRLRIVETDLAQPRLGLSDEAFGRLADELDVIWHSAGNIDLDDDLANLRRVNVDGTRHVLELAAAGARRPVVRHISTAFVGGAQRDGVSYEDELADAHGFENAYERSKYEAEVLVRAWARATGRPVLVMRPSILVTDLPPDPALPAHPLQFVARIVQASLRGGALTGADVPDALRPLVRLKGHPHGHLNLMPVESAATVMVRLASRTPSGTAGTYHVVHDHDVAVTTLAALVERLAPVRLRIVEEKPDDPSPLEAVADLYPGFTPYLGHRRRFDDTRVRTLLGPVPSGVRVDLDYLAAGLSPGRTVSTGGAP